MTKTYKNMVSLCHDHRAPKLDYNQHDVADIIQQYYDLCYRQYHTFYKENNPTYRQMLDIIECFLSRKTHQTAGELKLALIQAVKEIKNGPLNTLENLTLAPHVIMRSYNLFNSLLRSIMLFMSDKNSANQEAAK